IGARKRTSVQGIFLIQPNIPLPPFFLPTRSNTVNMANAVIKEGNPITILIPACASFNPSDIPGSTIWWWNPPGIFEITSKIKTTLVNVSLNNFPPITLGTTTYQTDTADKYQIFTNV